MTTIILHYTDYIIACAAWVFTLTRLHRIASLESLRHPAFHAWVAVLFFSISVTFQIDDLYMVIGHNLAWIASYVTMALAIYFVAVAILSKLRSRHQTRLLRVYLILTLTVLGELYLVCISLSPNHPEHDIPQSAWELLFMLLMYLYAAILGGVSLIAILKHLPQERVRTARVRAVFLCSGAILPILFFLYKISLASRSFFFPLLDYSTETQIAQALMLASGVLWMTAFLPKASYVGIVRLYAYAEKLAYYPRARKMALCLEKECQRKSLPSPSEISHPGWWELVRNPDQHIYKITVAILDRRTLLGYPATTPDRGDPLSAIHSIKEGSKVHLNYKNRQADTRKKKEEGKSMNTKPFAIGAVLLMALILSLIPGSPVKDYFVSAPPVEQINATSTITPTPSGSSSERQRVYFTSTTDASPEESIVIADDDNAETSDRGEKQPDTATLNEINLPTPPAPPIRQGSPTSVHPSPTPPAPPNRTSTPPVIFPTVTAPPPPFPTPPAPPIGTP